MFRGHTEVFSRQTEMLPMHTKMLPTPKQQLCRPEHQLCGPEQPMLAFNMSPCLLPTWIHVGRPQWQGPLRRTGDVDSFPSLKTFIFLSFPILLASPSGVSPVAGGVMLIASALIENLHFPSVSDTFGLSQWREPRRRWDDVDSFSLIENLHFP